MRESAGGVYLRERERECWWCLSERESAGGVYLREI